MVHRTERTTLSALLVVCCLIEFDTIQMLHGRAVAEVAEEVAIQDVE